MNDLHVYSVRGDSFVPRSVRSHDRLDVVGEMSLTLGPVVG